MIGRRLLGLLVAAGIAFGGGVAIGQTAHDDGKAFGALLRPRAATNAKTTPTPSTIPGYVASTPPETSYYTSPGSLAPAAAAAAPGTTGYQVVTSSVATRAHFAPVDLDATVARGRTVAADPMTYVAGYGVAGASGSCHPLPPSTPSGATYEVTCNTGYTIDPSVPHSCVIPVTPQFASTYRYECTDGDYRGNHTASCDPFYAAACTVTASRHGRCLEGAWPDCVEPGDPIYTMTCSAVVPGQTLLGSSTAYTGSVTDTSACVTWAGDATCSAATDVCTDSDPVTRVVMGIPVTQPCWAWSRTYTCGGGLSAAPSNDCSSLPTGCVFEREDCLSPAGLPCTTTDRVYKCPVPPGPPDKTQFICDGDVYCLNGSCDTIVRTPNTDFANAAVALNAASQAGKEFDPASLTLFKGSRQTCQKAIFGLINCCVPRGLPLLGGCNAADVALKKMQDKGLCSLVGSYCSSHTLFGICLQKKEAHCCYLSKISRILQEQGRVQIGKPYGDPSKETCPGFTMDEFQRLDLSRMDFSEIYADFTDAAVLPDELATTTSMQTKITDYFATHH
ncbi:MAG: conjugal transfer protein TraN [Janthinobacterium lividum]